MKQLQAYFSGQIQGVGFRYTAADLADELGIVGWVRNLPDGSVELLAEGEEEKINNLLEQLKKYFREKITNIETSWSNATGEFSSFDITHWK